MENPSLQIGNDNWAIKEDNLLGYSTAGTRFVPQPITMTRATLGTRINPSGLVEDVALLGSEEVTNGDFSNGGTDWTIQSGTINFTGGAEFVGSGIIKQTSILSSIPTYKITYEVTSVSGNPNFQLYVNYTWYSAPSTIGVHTVYERINNTVFYLRNNSSDNITIDNVSVKEATIDNLPRVDYTDGTSSLLVEPQSTNLVTSSEDFTDSSWTKLGAGTGSTSVVTSNYAISPDGTQNATRLVCDLNGGTTTSDQSIIYDLDSSNTSQSISIYIKSNTGLNQNIYFANTYGTGDTAIVTSEWQRFEFNHSTSNHTFSLGLRGDTGADDTADILIWGAQAESNSYATSYIKTSGSTVTRNQETYTKTGISDKIGQTEGTFFIELSKPVLEPDSYYLISLNNAASNSDDNSVAIGFENSNDFFLRVQSNGTDVFYSNNFDALNVNTFYKIAVSYKSGQSLIYIDGSPITPNGGNLSNAFAFTATLDNLSFDFNGNNGLPFYGKVKQLQVFKTALTDSELETLTT